MNMDKQAYVNHETKAYRGVLAAAAEAPKDRLGVSGKLKDAGRGQRVSAPAHEEGARGRYAAVQLIVLDGAVALRKVVWQLALPAAPHSVPSNVEGLPGQDAVRLCRGGNPTR